MGVIEGSDLLLGFLGLFVEFYSCLLLAHADQDDLEWI